MTLLIVLIAGCGGGPAASTTREPSPTPASTDQATPTSAPSTTDQADGLFPWLPFIDPGVSATFEVDTFVVARSDAVPVSASPGGPPYRFDTGDPDPSTHPILSFGEGGLLVVIHGPVMVDDVEWYLLTPAYVSIDIPTGWSPLSSESGEPFLRAEEFTCPPSPIATEQLSPFAMADGLPACHGDAEITLVGDLVCTPGPDTFSAGATWLEGGSCRFDLPPTVYGMDPSLAPGRYSVTGHFDDPQARECRPLDGPQSPEARLAAVLFCRRAFVATSAIPAD
jgi:hypothetical protein